MLGFLISRTWTCSSSLCGEWSTKNQGVGRQKAYSTPVGCHTTNECWNYLLSERVSCQCYGSSTQGNGWENRKCSVSTMWRKGTRRP